MHSDRWFRFLPVALAVLFMGCPAFYSTSPRYGRKKPQAETPAPVRPVKITDKRQGKLGWPAAGTVVGRYGVKVHPKWGTKTKNLGLDIACAKGSPVKAAYDGKVSFADQFMGYGRMIIVDHGEQLHSIYSRLAESRVEVGASVRKGETIAFSGDTLHFEVRKAGQSDDPELWLGPR